MARRYRSDKSAEEKVGRAKLMPFKIAIAAISLAVYIVVCVVVYIPGVIYYLVRIDKGASMHNRIVWALLWPAMWLLEVLSFNDPLSVEGFDNPLLNGVTNVLDRLAIKVSRNQ